MIMIDFAIKKEILYSVFEVTTMSHDTVIDSLEL